MRILVCLHHLEIGGSQLNALDLAIKARERGHHIEVFATHTGVAGPVADLVKDKGLPLTLVKHPLERPNCGQLYRASIASSLTTLVKKRAIDIVHAYEYSLILDAFYGPSLRLGTRLVGTVYGMKVPTWLPRTAMLVAGTRELVANAQAVGQRVALIEPPVDTASDSPEKVDGLAFRLSLGVGQDEVLLVTVSRLEPEMKEEGIIRTMDAVGELAAFQLRYVVVGTGPSHRKLAVHARKINEALGREAVIMKGLMTDPRPAYAAADIAIGMGGSALRSMAFSKPLIVVGTNGFSRPFTERTAVEFFEKGLYGVGTGALEHLTDQIMSLMDPSVRGHLGSWGRQVVLEHYSLDAAASILFKVYTRAEPHSAQRRLKDAVYTGIHRIGADLAGSSVRARVSPIVRRFLSKSPKH